ncbi:hypothetical protein BDW60DRAFT_212515 [Aspergillus nidulans var. acristatus]
MHPEFALLHIAAANSFKGLGLWETRDTGNIFELIVAIPDAPADERQMPEWVISLTEIELTGSSEVKARSRSYTIKGTPVVSPTGGVGGMTTSLTTHEEYLPLGKLLKEELATFEYIFRSIRKGPNNFFIAQLLACHWERRLVTSIAVEMVTYRACY